jgi:hypothetical protein
MPYFTCLIIDIERVEKRSEQGAVAWKYAAVRKHGKERSRQLCASAVALQVFRKK